MNVYHMHFLLMGSFSQVQLDQVLEFIHVNQLQHSINQPTHDKQQGDCTPKQWTRCKLDALDTLALISSARSMPPDWLSV